MGNDNSRAEEAERHRAHCAELERDAARKMAEHQRERVKDMYRNEKERKELAEKYAELNRKEEERKQAAENERRRRDEIEREAARQKEQRHREEQEAVQRKELAAENDRRRCAERERDESRQQEKLHKEKLEDMQRRDKEREELEERKRKAKDWRKPPSWTSQFRENTITELQAVKPKSKKGVRNFNILVLGQVGAGKSSFLNTVASATETKRTIVKRKAEAGSTDGSLTRTYKMTRMQEGLHFKICDTQGLEASNAMDAPDVDALLDGCIPNNTPFTDGMSEKYKESVDKRKIHCVCAVVDGSTIDIVDPDSLAKWKRVQKRATVRGIPQVIILTKVDLMSEDVDNDLQRLFKDWTIEEMVKKTADVLGVPINYVLPMKNYHDAVEMQLNVDVLALFTIRHVLATCEDYLETYEESDSDSD